MAVLTEPSSQTRGARLAFELVGGRTAVVGAEAASPLKLLCPRHDGRAAWVYSGTYGGGLVDGDHVEFEIDVASGACAALATQASTKIYPGPAGASQRLRASVAEGAALAVVPDPIVCYAGSRYAQRQEYHLAAGASVAVVDWLTAGRISRDERWAFDRYESSLSIVRGGRALLWDALRLDPEQGGIAGRLGRFNVLALAAVVGPAFQAGAERLVAELAAEPARRHPPLFVNAAPLGGDGTLLRVAAESTEEAAKTLRRSLSFVWEALGDDPWSRRP